jgi:hypothetical protein
MLRSLVRMLSVCLAVFGACALAALVVVGAVTVVAVFHPRAHAATVWAADEALEVVCPDVRTWVPDAEAGRPEPPLMTHIPVPPPASTLPTKGGTRIVIDDVDLPAGQGAMVHIDHLVGRLVPLRGEVLNLDRGDSYTLFIDAAVLGVDATGIELMATDAVQKALAKPGPDGKRSPLSLKVLHIELRGGAVHAHGTALFDGLEIPFDLVIAVTATPNGQLKVELLSADVATVPVELAMRVFGVKMSDIVGEKQPGLRGLAGLAILVDPAALTPEPRLATRITGVSASGDLLRLVFGNKALLSTTNAHQLVLTGGIVRMGNMMMWGPSFSLVDADHKDPLHIDLARLQQQLFASVAHWVPGGARVDLVDLEDLKRP